MKISKIGINGFGRIGRQLTKLLLGSENIKIAAINAWSISILNGINL